MQALRTRAGVTAFVRLSRLTFLTGGFLGGALGTAVAVYERGRIDVLAFALAQLTITAAHLMTQYANEYYDRASDALTTRTRYSGGSGVLVEGALAPGVALGAALVCLAANWCGVALLLATGHRLAGLLGALCALFAWAYSAPPLRLLARGLGELDTALVVAVLVPLCAYAAQMDALDARVLATTLPGAAAMFAMMLCVELPDVAADRATGKRNLVVRLGKRWAAFLAYGAVAAILPAVVIALWSGVPAWYGLLEIAALVPSAWLAFALAPLVRGVDVSYDAIAGRGVALFALVGLLGVTGFVAALRWH